MKMIKQITLMAFVLVILFGCKKEEETETLIGTFRLNNERYDIFSKESATTGVLQLIHDSEEGITNGSLTISGNNGLKKCSIQIGINYETNTSISGDYTNSDTSYTAHTYDPWLTNYSISSSSFSFPNQINDATGTLKIKKNSASSYTVTFNFVFSDSSKASGSITQLYTVQEMSF